MLKKHVGESRRIAEIEKLRLLKQFDSAPAIGQFKNGEAGFVKGTGHYYFRDGNKLWKIEATEV